MGHSIPFALVFITLSALSAQSYPQAEISNGIVRVGFYLPDPENGYYRGTRFDWSGVIRSLTFQGHSYFSPWQEKHDPLVHNSISGPVDTFDELFGCQEAQPGGPGFLVLFPFGPGGRLSPDKTLDLRGRELHFLKDLQRLATAMVIREVFRPAAEDHDVTVENQTTGACVNTTGDQPLDVLRVFFRKQNVRPETFFRLRMDLGQVEQWASSYFFYVR